MSTVSVKIPGTKSRVSLTLNKGDTAADALKGAAVVLGVSIDTTKVSAVVDGQAADPDEPLAETATRVDGAPMVRNG